MLTDRELDVICRMINASAITGYRMARQETIGPLPEPKEEQFKITLDKRLLILNEISKNRRKSR